MSISEHKILSADLLNKQVTDAADRPTGTAQQIKYLFDRLALEVVIPALNALIDELTNSGASSVGTSISGVAGTDVQTVLEGMKALIDDRYTKEQSDGLLGDKADKTTIAPMLADMSIDENGVITVTRKNGTTKSWDTALEKIAVNFDFDKERQKLTLTLEDGTTKEVDLSAFVKPNEFTDSATIDFTAGADGTVTATIRAGSVTDEMLDSALKEALIAYRDAAATSAAAAKASEDNALTYKQAAAAARTGAEKAQTEAAVSEINASVYAEGGTLAGHEGEVVQQVELPGAKGYMLMAQQYANSAATSASAADTRANAAADSAKRAEDAAERAGEIVGGDFATKTELNAHVGDTTKHVTADERTAWNSKAPGSHVGDSTHITAAERTAWNAKSGKAVAFTVTLSTVGWSENTQAVSDSRFLTDGYAYSVTPDSGSFSAYGEAMIYADNVTTAGQMRFHCSEVPTTDLTVNILRIEVSV